MQALLEVMREYQNYQYLAPEKLSDVNPKLAPMQSFAQYLAKPINAIHEFILHVMH